MTAPSPALAPPWPNRWVATMLAPEGLGIAAAAMLVWVMTKDVRVSLSAAAVFLAAAYLRRLLAVARLGADQRMPPVTPAEALRHDAPRFAASVLARAAGATVLGAVAGLDLGTAALLGLLVGLLIGWVQLVRQVAILLTFRE